MLNSIRILGAILDESYGPVKWFAVTVVEECPNTFNVVEIDVLDNISLTFGSITSGEVVEGCTLPDSKQSIAHINIVVGIVFGQPGQEIPRSTLSAWQS